MGFFSKIGKGISNAVKAVGDFAGKAVKVAAPILAIGASAIPVIGPAASSLISKVGGIAGGVNSALQGLTSTTPTFTTSIGGAAPMLTPSNIIPSGGSGGNYANGFLDDILNPKTVKIQKDDQNVIYGTANNNMMLLAAAFVGVIMLRK